MFRVAIPARHASTRLPGKPLALVAGLPMILHVHRLALRSAAAEVIVATDDDRIRAVCVAAGADVEMTGLDHVSGTDRIAELAALRGWTDEAIVVNVQGDEPMLPPVLIDQAAALLAASPGAAIATLATPIQTESDYLDANVVKVVTRDNGQALYFSRAPIPWDRDADAATGSGARHRGARRHLGIYAYRVSALKALAGTAATTLELKERLEQLRALQMGLEIVVADAIAPSGPGVDSADDLARVDQLMRRGAGP